MKDKELKEALQLARNIVASWPTWKQTSLQVTAMPKTPVPSATSGSQTSSGSTGGTDSKND